MIKIKIKTKYNYHPLRGILVIDLVHVENVDLDRKRPRRKIKVIKSPDIAPTATLIDLDLTNVNDLKIERNAITIEKEREVEIEIDKEKEVGNETDTVLDSIEISVTSTTIGITIDHITSNTMPLLNPLKFLHKFSCR